MTTTDRPRRGTGRERADPDGLGRSIGAEVVTMMVFLAVLGILSLALACAALYRAADLVLSATRHVEDACALLLRIADVVVETAPAGRRVVGTVAMPLAATN